ncbi:hypothetical protein GC175_18500 [bacterium]|nr:hypothetical protein [bacterium]
MSLSSLIFLLIIVALLGVNADRSIAKRKRKQRSTTKRRLQHFRNWADASFADNRTLQQWLAQLPDGAIQAIIDKLLEFCFDMGFELDWVLEKKTAHGVALTARLQEIVAQYVESCYEADLSQDDIYVFESWLNYNEAPFGKDQQVFAEHLLTQLIDAGVSPRASQSLLITPDKERDTYIHYALREAAQKDPDAFQSVLKNVLATPLELAQV